MKEKLASEGTDQAAGEATEEAAEEEVVRQAQP